MIFVDMVRPAEALGGRDRFSLSLASWQLMLELGVTFGWQPQGTTYVLPPTSKLEAVVRHDYQPGDVRDHKNVSAEDAINWARALAAAKSSTDFARLIANGQQLEAGAPIQASFDEFVEYAYGGAFAFAARDRADESKR